MQYVIVYFLLFLSNILLFKLSSFIVCTSYKLLTAIMCRYVKIKFRASITKKYYENLSKCSTYVPLQCTDLELVNFFQFRFMHFVLIRELKPFFCISFTKQRFVFKLLCLDLRLTSNISSAVIQRFVTCVILLSGNDLLKL